MFRGASVYFCLTSAYGIDFTGMKFGIEFESRRRRQKMKIAVSACLLGDNCKYNGGNNYSEKVKNYIEGHEVIPICPEVLGGLSTPREPAEIDCGIVKNKDGTSVDAQFRKGAELALDIVIKNHVIFIQCFGNRPMFVYHRAKNAANDMRIRSLQSCGVIHNHTLLHRQCTFSPAIRPIACDFNRNLAI